MAKMTVEQLQEEHSEMLATATDLGVAVPEDLTIDFDTVEVGATVCSNLDALIRKFRAGLDAADEDNDEAEEDESDDKPIADEVETVQVAPKTKSKKKSAPKKQPADDAGATLKEKQVVKKETVKSAKATKKVAKGAGAKKAAAAPAKGAGAKKAGGSPIGRSKYSDDMKITAIKKDIMDGVRKGTVWHERLSKVAAAVGKTVASFKGDRPALSSAVQKGLIKVA